jgi:hypothetical protein
MSHTVQQIAGWIVCRGFREIPVPDANVLPVWAEHGRLKPDDYLVNPRIETCFQAKDDPELHAIFLRKRPIETILRALKIAS